MTPIGSIQFDDSIVAFNLILSFISLRRDFPMTKINNIFSDVPDSLVYESFWCILKRGGIEVERIVSKGHVTPAGQWYDQEHDEWVLLLQGEAILLYQNETQPLHLHPGDNFLIPAHCRHRVEWTEPAVETIWLTIHWR